MNYKIQILAHGNIPYLNRQGPIIKPVEVNEKGLAKLKKIYNDKVVIVNGVSFIDIVKKSEDVIKKSKEEIEKRIEENKKIIDETINKPSIQPAKSLFGSSEEINNEENDVKENSEIKQEENNNEKSFSEEENREEVEEDENLNDKRKKRKK